MTEQHLVDLRPALRRPIRRAVASSIVLIAVLWGALGAAGWTRGPFGPLGALALAFAVGLAVAGWAAGLTTRRDWVRAMLYAAGIVGATLVVLVGLAEIMPR